MVLAQLLAVACSTVTCPMDTVVTCNYVFYNADGVPAPLADTLTVNIQKNVLTYTYRKEGKNDTLLRKQSQALIDSGYTETVGITKMDTALVNRLVNGSNFKVAMSYYNPVDTLILRYSLIALPDTIYISHTSYTHVETPECGAYRFHTLKDVRSTDRGIDRIEIINPTVNYEGADNIKIYFNSFAQ